jgi:steroid 5-alpha reductase family enzyme
MSGMLQVAAVTLPGLAASATLALLAWVVSLARRDASVVDIAWSLLVLCPALAVAVHAWPLDARAAAAIALAVAWALRLSAHIAWRHRGQPEDHRYQAMRARHGHRFGLKSLYLVFGLQVLLAWVVSAPLAALAASDAPWGALDTLGLAVAAGGLLVEAVADAQLASFRADPSRRGTVLDTGLWRYSRHPNYFGECAMWWGWWLMALSAGAGWTIVSPLLMTWLLLRISGVALLERDMVERRPAYADYVRRTNAFVPGRPRR